MKKFLSPILFSLLLIGCSTAGIPGKQVTVAQDAIAKQEKKIDTTSDELVKNDKGKRIQTAVLAQGIQYSLQQVTNTSIQVETAKNLNERVISIEGKTCYQKYLTIIVKILRKNLKNLEEWRRCKDQ